MAAFLRGLDGGDDEVRAHAVGDVGLLAVDHPAAVDALGARGDRGDVGAGARLGDAERADLLAADRRHEVALLLLLGAELPDRRRGDVDVRADARGRAAGADPRHLLAQHRLVQVVAALAAVGLRVLQPEQALRGELREHLVGEPALVLPLLRVRRQLALDEAADRLSQLFVLVGERGEWMAPLRLKRAELVCLILLSRAILTACVATTLDIDEDMLAKAREILGTRGVKDTVDEALREVVRREAGKRIDRMATKRTMICTIPRSWNARGHSPPIS